MKREARSWVGRNGSRPIPHRAFSRAILNMVERKPALIVMDLVADPKSVKVNVTSGSGMEIEWKDGHKSVYSFPFLRDACPCALCNEEREKRWAPGGRSDQASWWSLPMFKAAARPTEVKPVGKYAISFHWNDGHEHGIYSWEYLREHCPCAECKARRAMERAERCQQAELINPSDTEKSQVKSLYSCVSCASVVNN